MMNHTNKDYMRGVPKACDIFKFLIYLMVCCLILFFMLIPIADILSKDESKLKYENYPSEPIQTRKGDRYSYKEKE